MKKMIFFIVIFSAMFLISACGNGSDSNSNGDDNQDKTNDETKKLQVMEDDEAGKYLADNQGMTLYLFTNDEKDTSNCTEDCLENWPVFMADNFDVPDGFNKDDFSTITRQDTDEEQLTYKGYPLYYFAKDKEQGDVNGQGVKDVWYVASEQSIQDHFQESSNPQAKEIDEVLTSLDAFHSTLETSTNDIKEINNKGKELSENWEQIEEKVEKHDAEAYENIEKSLYPLIDEAQTEKPNIEKLNKLTEETKEKLTEYQDEISSSS